MKRRSITLKLLPLILCSFFLVFLGVLILSRIQLTDLIDKSQQSIFTEKIDVIWQTLERVDDQLQKTGLVEAYGEDFRESALRELKSTYYQQEQLYLKPILTDENSTVILHPTLPAGHILESDGSTLFAQQTSKQGQFYTTVDGRSMWCIYRYFEPWRWIIIYAIPIEKKYSDVGKFSTLLFLTMLSITLVVVVLLSLVITWLMRPIGELTETAQQIAGGNLEHPIKTSGSDEIGLLSRSFDTMRNSIQEQISTLEREVRERKKVENELRNFEQYLADIINSMPSAIIGINTDNRVTLWNNNVEILTGTPAARAIGTPLVEMFPELESIFPLITESLELGEMKKLSRQERETKKGWVSEDVTIYPLSTQSAEGVGAVIRIDDVSKEHELEQQVQHSRQMEAIGQLAGGVAHDFNNMLAGISGACELLEVSLSNKDKELKYIDIIKNATERAAGLTAKLLAFSRKGKQISTPVELHSVIQDSIAILERSIDRKISIQKELTAEHSTVIGDPSQLQSGILNICVNARDALPDGGKILISTSNVEFDEEYCSIDTKFTPGRYIKLSLQDNGQGIPPEIQAKVFEPFFTTKEVGKGTGLGLAAVYGMVEEHHGTIRLYSEPGEGTVFQIFLPTEEDTASFAPATKETSVHGTGTILVVDDEEIIRATASLLLERIGYDVLLAANGREAVDIYRERWEEIDLIILDMVMPVMDGREAFDLILDVNPDAKVILSSGYAKNVQMAGMKDKGLAGAISKPFSQFELSKLIAGILT